MRKDNDSEDDGKAKRGNKKRKRESHVSSRKPCHHGGKIHKATEAKCWENLANKKSKPVKDKEKDKQYKREFKQFSNFMATMEKK